VCKQEESLLVGVESFPRLDPQLPLADQLVDDIGRLEQRVVWEVFMPTWDNKQNKIL